MKKKKSLVFVMSIVLVLILSVTLVACGGNNNTTSGGNTDTGGVKKEANLTSKIDLKTNTSNHKEQYDLFVKNYNYGKIFVGSIEEATKETEVGGLLEGLEVDTYGSIENQDNVVKNGQFIWKQYKSSGNITTYLVPIGDVIYLETAPDQATVDYYADLFDSDYIVDGKYLIDSWSSEEVYSFIDNNTEMVNGLRLSADKKTLINGNNATGDVTVPETIIEVKKYAFCFNNDITSVMLSNNITELSRYTFYKCNNLTKINIPRDMIELKSATFHSCPSIKEVVFDTNAKLEVIRQSFIMNGSVGVENIVIPKSVIAIENAAFKNWIDLKTFSVEEGSQLKYLGISVNQRPEYKNIANYHGTQIFEIDYNTFDRNNLLLETIDLSNATELVGLPDGLCYDCWTIKNLILPTQITELPNNTFHACGMSEYVVPNQITKLGTECFSFCKNMTKLTIHKDVNYIGNFAFLACFKLNEIIFEGTVAEWEAIEKGEYMFRNCDLIKQITCSDGVVTIEEIDR